MEKPEFLPQIFSELTWGKKRLWKLVGVVRGNIAHYQAGLRRHAYFKPNGEFFYAEDKGRLFLWAGDMTEGKIVEAIKNEGAPNKKWVPVTVISGYERGTVK